MGNFKVTETKEYNKLLEIESDVSGLNTENNVPTVNAVANTNSSEVIGNKNDTTAGTSIVSLLKLIDSLVDAIKAKTDNLPSDPSDQSMIDAKLGVVTDFAAHQTLLGYQNSLYQHVHQQARCYPSLADGIVVTGGVPAWTLGNFAEIIPANTITSAFDIHFIVVENVSAQDIYEMVLYTGTVGNEVEIGRVRIDRESATSGAQNVPIQIPAQSANSRISAKLASKSGGDSATISVYYHWYGN